MYVAEWSLADPFLGGIETVGERFLAPGFSPAAGFCIVDPFTIRIEGVADSPLALGCLSSAVGFSTAEPVFGNVEITVEKLSTIESLPSAAKFAVVSPFSRPINGVTEPSIAPVFFSSPASPSPACVVCLDLVAHSTDADLLGC